MKSFSAFIGAIAATLAAVTNGQYTYNETTGVFTCATANAAYCAGDSLETNIIIRCNGFIGQPGNCNDNLAGQPPLGVNYAPCYQTSPTAGNAACSKNCKVYGGGNSTSTLPSSVCIPTYTASSTFSATGSSTLTTPELTTSTAYATSVITISSCAPTVTDCPYTTKPTVTTVTTAVSTTVFPVSSSSGPVDVPSPNSVSSAGELAPVSVVSTTSLSASATISTQPSILIATATGTGGSGSGSGSGSRNSTATGGNGGSKSATATPVGPSSSPSTTGSTSAYTGAAVANSAGSALLAVGLFVAYFL